MEQKQWRIVEFKTDNESGLTTHVAKEGHALYTGRGIVNRFVVTQPLEYGDRMMESFIGAHVAEIPVAYDGRDVALANARLIAAAPELLEALKDAVAVIHSLDAKREYEGNVGLMEAAIANATGTEVA